MSYLGPSFDAGGGPYAAPRALNMPMSDIATEKSESDCGHGKNPSGHLPFQWSWTGFERLGPETEIVTDSLTSCPFARAGVEASQRIPTISAPRIDTLRAMFASLRWIIVSHTLVGVERFPTGSP